MKDIQLQLSIDEVNQILEALGTQPYASVFQLVASIQSQAQAQVQAPDTKPLDSGGSADMASRQTG